MKAISLWQPWASAWLHPKYKAHETRSWATSYRGLLAVHATKAEPSTCLDLVCQSAGMREFFQEIRDGLAFPASMASVYKNLPRGKVVGIVRLTGCLRVEDVRDSLTPAQDDWGDYSDGRWAWLAEPVEIFKRPIEASGGQRIWNWDGMP